MFRLAVLPSLHFAEGNSLFKTKYELCTSDIKINTLFIGSSHIHNQIIPSLFDSISDGGTNSFNLGVPGLNNPESYFLVERILENEKMQLENIFIDITPLQSIPPQNLFKMRTSYYLNYSMIKQILPAVLNEDYSLLTKAYRFGSYFLSGIYNFSGVELLKDREESELDNVDLLKNRGYEILSDKASILYQKRREQLLSKPSLLDTRRKSIIEQYSEVAQELDNDHVNCLKLLVSKCKERSINLFFLITPRRLDYTRILPASSALKDVCVFDIGNPQIYPKLYMLDYSFDIGHLNENGARLFTEIIAERYLNCNV